MNIDTDFGPLDDLVDVSEENDKVDINTMKRNAYKNLFKLLEEYADVKEKSYLNQTSK